MTEKKTAEKSSDAVEKLKRIKYVTKSGGNSETEKGKKETKDANK